MGKLTAEQKVCEYNRGRKAASEGRSRSSSEPRAYPFESDRHYEERREAFNQGYGIIDPTPMAIRRSSVIQNLLVQARLLLLLPSAFRRVLQHSPSRM